MKDVIFEANDWTLIDFLKAQVTKFRTDKCTISFLDEVNCINFLVLLVDQLSLGEMELD